MDIWVKRGTWGQEETSVYFCKGEKEGGSVQVPQVNKEWTEEVKKVDACQPELKSQYF